MTDPPDDPANGRENDREITRLAAELEQAELYEQRLRGVIAAVREELSRGNVERALSMLNEALNEIDDATDVVTHPRPTTEGNR